MALVKRRATAFAVAFAACVFPLEVLAHSSIAGMEGFPTGLLHPFLTADQLLTLLALGVMLGLAWPDRFSFLWFVFAVTALAGMCLGQLGFLPHWQGLALLSIAALAAAISAIFPAGVSWLSVTLTGLGGLFIGFASTPDTGPLPATILFLAGSFVGTNFAVFYVAYGVGRFRVRFTRPWAQIGLRIVAAWIAAISILMAALAFVAG